MVRDYNYYDRQNEFGAGYNERALFLAYLIHETFKVEERDEVFVEFVIDTTDSNFQGLDLLIYFNFYTTWQKESNGIFLL